jgi:DNA-directed RNA polymerase subunit N (RpoN/RPB10)
MIVPVRCTCGKVLSDKYRAYLEEVERALGGGDETSPGTLTGPLAFDKKAGEVRAAALDRLAINRYCCRTQMLTSIEIVDRI